MLNEEIITKGVEKGIICASMDLFAIGMVIYTIGWIVLPDSNIVERLKNKFSKKNKYTTYR
jgi:hypothetical protein